jgi:hypothetical protein
VNASGRLLGIISRVDVLAVYSRPDQEIRNEVTQAVLPGILPGSAKKVHVAVREGIVTIKVPLRQNRPQRPSSTQYVMFKV